MAATLSLLTGFYQNFRVNSEKGLTLIKVSLLSYTSPSGEVNTDFRSIDDLSYVTFKTAGNVYEVKYSLRCSRGGTTKKLNKDEYVDTRSGEVKSFNHYSSRYDDLKSVFRSITLGRDLIRSNCVDPLKCRFLTLTYADNMTDTNKLYNDFKNFQKRLPPEYVPFKWISAAEPQRRGAWHLHVIFIYDSVAPFIPNSVIAKAWKQGFVNVRSVDNCDDMGAYLCAYLTDIDVDDTEKVDEKKVKTIIDENGKPKRVVKGERLPLYPAGMHIFRHSKNCIQPDVKIMRADKANEIVKDYPLVFESTKQIIDTESGFTNIVSTRVYNSRRKAN